jgi:hypothetical protein
VGQLSSANTNTFSAVNMSSPEVKGFKSLSFSTPGK